MGAIGDPYCSLEEVKAYLKIPASHEANDDLLEQAIASSTSEINHACNRQFNKIEQDSGGGAATTQEYYPESSGLAYIDDFYTTDDLVVEVDGTPWTLGTDFTLLPLNHVVDGEEGWPYWKIAPNGHSFPVRRPWDGPPTLTVTALWGWEDVPAPIRQACLIMSAETFQMKDAPFGVAGMDIFGTPLRVRDNRIAAGKIARYSRNRLQIG